VRAPSDNCLRPAKTWPSMVGDMPVFLQKVAREPGRFERLLKVAPSEPPRVRALLGAIGQDLGQPKHRLSTFRKSWNALSRFDFGILAALKHAREWQAKERKIRETV
jgi:hypothetical protein